MSRYTFPLSLLLLFTAGCGSDEPETIVTTDTASDAEVRIAEAEAARAEAEARLAELNAAQPPEASGGSATPATPPATGTTSGSAPSGGSSAGESAAGPPRPGLKGIGVPSGTTAQMIDGSTFFNFCETYDKTSVRSFQGMEVCYTGTVRQQGNRLIGSGEKNTESGKALTGAARTPIRIEGYLYPDNFVSFNYTVKGANRVTRGVTNYFGNTMEPSSEGNGWNGTFSSDAASSSGPSFFFVSIDSGA